MSQSIVMSKENNDVLVACADMIAGRRLGARITVVEGQNAGTSMALDYEKGPMAGVLPDGVASAAMADARSLMGVEKSMALSYGDAELFVDVITPRPHLLIFGAVHIAQALCALARHLDFDVTVSDARPAFLTAERFPHADQRLVGWPDQLADELSFDRRCYVVILSHDHRFEEPLWPMVLESPVRYIGAMGSRGTAAARKERLAEAGFSSEEISRIRGPIGLKIGADSPAEVAVAILGEMIAARRRPSAPMDLVGRPRLLRRSKKP